MSEWASGAAAAVDPSQLRWGPEPLLEPAEPGAEGAVDFLAGLATMAGAGDPTLREGLAVHMYNCNAPMGRRCFSNADGDLLIVPETGTLLLQTEMGDLQVEPCEVPRVWLMIGLGDDSGPTRCILGFEPCSSLSLSIFRPFPQLFFTALSHFALPIVSLPPRKVVVVPRGVKFRVGFAAGTARARGYALELYANAHFELPSLGPIGSNGLANARDFLHPAAKFEDSDEPYSVVHKFGGKLFEADLGHSPFDVVAWHGNYAPFKYDLRYRERGERQRS